MKTPYSSFEARRFCWICVPEPLKLKIPNGKPLIWKPLILTPEIGVVGFPDASTWPSTQMPASGTGPPRVQALACGLCGATIVV